MSDNEKTLQAQQDDAMIMDAYERLLEGYMNSNHRKKKAVIEKAFKFARAAHAGVRRRSGEPYIMHPLAVATIVNQEIGLGTTSICAALLHDVVEDTDSTVEDIESQFGSKVAQIVEGLTKISGGIFGDMASAQAENFRKLLLTMGDDIRVVLIKMADRLHNMRTLASMPPQKQYKIAGETLYIYAPLAHRLGLFAIKTELEDLSFKYEHPEIYQQIERQISDSDKHRTEVFDRFAAPIRERLDKMGFGILFLSNNKEDRVKSFRNGSVPGAYYIHKASKPSRSGYFEAMKIMGTEAGSTVFIGDQLFTNVWGAKRSGIKNILVAPIAKKEEIQIVLKRVLEKIVIGSYIRSGLDKNRPHEKKG